MAGNGSILIGGGLKSVTLWGDEGWNDLATGAALTEGQTTPAMLYRRIPWLYRGVNLRADAVAAMPFEIRRGKTVIDTSSDWQNEVGFLPNPARLFWLLEACLTLAGRAYLWRERTAAETRTLRYILPTSIRPVIDQALGLTGFKRYNGAREIDAGLEDVVYFWLPDTEVEIGEPKQSPALAAMAAAGVLYAVDLFAQEFFSHGAIKATILATKSSTPAAERERLKEWLNNFIFGGLRTAHKAEVINADAVTINQIGEGIEGLQDSSLTAEKRSDISTALGLPQTKLFSEGAAGLGGGGVVAQDDVRFYAETVVPECNIIAAALNEQVFTPLGLTLVFRPETLDAFQEDEAQRAGSLLQLTSAGIPLLMAMDLLGYELTDEQRAALEQAAVDKQERAEQMTAQLAQGQSDQPEQQQQPAQGQDEAAADRKRWKAKALKSLERGRGAGVPFESEHIEAGEHARIAAGLEAAGSVEDVEAVFAQPSPDAARLASTDGEYKALLDRLDRIIELAGADEPAATA